ncbi:hypothetical protein KAX22_01680, partial [bacterium]|nr:hypothetical protein [bacterium]
MRATQFALAILLVLFVTTAWTPAAHGYTLWTANGVSFCTATGNQHNIQMVGDDAGCVIITWEDERSGLGDIYAQRINADGDTLWTADGVPICNVEYNQYYPQLVGDNSGGAIITWGDYRNGTDDNIYAQRVDANGDTLWPANGVAICTAIGNQESPQLVGDNSGGAIIAWADYRGGNWDIYSRRVHANGNPLWTFNGVAICTAVANQHYLRLVGDNSGGAIIAWEDDRNGLSDIYAQRVDANGNPLWTANGVVICTAANYQFDPQIVGDGSGGAIITWRDSRLGVSNYDIYAQRVDTDGNALWLGNGVAICTATDDQTNPQISTDGSGGAIITWRDSRLGVSNYDIYAQRVD